MARCQITVIASSNKEEQEHVLRVGSGGVSWPGFLASELVRQPSRPRSNLERECCQVIS